MTVSLYVRVTWGSKPLAFSECILGNRLCLNNRRESSAIRNTNSPSVVKDRAWEKSTFRIGACKEHTLKGN